MGRKIKLVVIIAVIGFVAFPVITLGRTFVSSLIEGKTVGEAIQILAQHLDSLTERVETLENKQEDQNQNTGGAVSTSTNTNEEYLEREARDSFQLRIPESERSKITPVVEPIE
ncbi:MAG: hypothetical protein PHW43_09960 [Syntrophales bacterium]|nr:hypothetical protein [Syntrophales bacterium]